MREPFLKFKVIIKYTLNIPLVKNYISSRPANNFTSFFQSSPVPGEYKIPVCTLSPDAKKIFENMFSAHYISYMFYRPICSLRPAIFLEFIALFIPSPIAVNIHRAPILSDQEKKKAIKRAINFRFLTLSIMQGTQVKNF